MSLINSDNFPDLGRIIPVRDSIHKYPIDMQRKKLVIETNVPADSLINAKYCRMYLNFFEMTTGIFYLDLDVCKETYQLQFCGAGVTDFLSNCNSTTRIWKIIKLELSFKLLCNDVTVADVDFGDAHKAGQWRCFQQVANRNVTSVSFNKVDKVSHVFSTEDLEYNTGIISICH